MSEDLPEIDPLELAIGALLEEADETGAERVDVVQRLVIVVREHIAERLAHQQSPDLTLISALVDAAGGMVTILPVHMERAHKGTLTHQEVPITGALVFQRNLPRSLIRLDS